MKIELKSGEVLEGTVISKALMVMVVKTEDNRLLLVSRYALKDPKLFKFQEDEAADSSDV